MFISRDTTIVTSHNCTVARITVWDETPRSIINGSTMHDYYIIPVHKRFVPSVLFRNSSGIAVTSNLACLNVRYGARTFNCVHCGRFLEMHVSAMYG